MDVYGHFRRIAIVTLNALIIFVITGNIPLIVCHLFYVIGRHYIIRDISLIINFMYILMQFLTILKTNSWAEAMFASIQT